MTWNLSDDAKAHTMRGPAAQACNCWLPSIISGTCFNRSSLDWANIISWEMHLVVRNLFFHGTGQSYPCSHVHVLFMLTPETLSSWPGHGRLEGMHGHAQWAGSTPSTHGSKDQTQCGICSTACNQQAAVTGLPSSTAARHMPTPVAPDLPRCAKPAKNPTCLHLWIGSSSPGEGLQVLCRCIRPHTVEAIAVDGGPAVRGLA